MTDADFAALQQKVGAIESALVSDAQERITRQGVLDADFARLEKALADGLALLWKAIEAQRLKLFGNGSPEGSVCWAIKHQGEAIADQNKAIARIDARVKLLEDQDKRIAALEAKARLPGQALGVVLQLLTLATLVYALWPKH
jgi:hypothetical protein